MLTIQLLTIFVPTLPSGIICETMHVVGVGPGGGGDVCGGPNLLCDLWVSEAHIEQLPGPHILLSYHLQAGPSPATFSTVSSLHKHPVLFQYIVGSCKKKTVGRTQMYFMIQSYLFSS